MHGIRRSIAGVCAAAACLLLAVTAHGAAASAPAASSTPPAASASAAAAAAAAPKPAPPPPLDTSPYSFRTVEGAGGVPLNVVMVGDASKPPILFIHGLGQSYLSFERQFRSELANDYYLVAFDLRGHGNSGKPWDRAAYADRATWGEDVANVVKALGLKKPLVVGWSYGTLVAVDYLRYAGATAVSGVEFVGAYGGLTPPPDVSPAKMPAAMVQNRQRQLSSAIDQNYAAAQFTARLLTAEPMPQDWTERTIAISMMLPHVAREGMFMRPLDSRDLLPQLAAVPFLLNVGTKDVSTPEPVARELARQLKDASVSVYEGNGHSPFVESPDRFNRELAAFARRAFGGSPAAAAR